MKKSEKCRAIMGTEPLLVRETVAQLRAEVLGPSADFNCDEFDLQGGEIGPLIEAAKTLPMMAQVRWVHGFNLHKLPAREHPALLTYLQAPSPSTFLVLSGDRPDGRLKLITTLRQMGALEVFDTPKQGALPGWLMQRAKKIQLGLAADAAVAIVQKVGDDLGMLAQTLEVLKIYAGADATLSREDVEEAVTSTRDASIFQLTDALGERHWPTVALLLTQLIASGVEPLAMVALLNRQLRLLLGTKTFTGSPAGLPAALGVAPFVANRLRQAATHFDEATLFSGLRQAEEIELTLKKHRRSGHSTLALWLLQLCGAQAEQVA